MRWGAASLSGRTIGSYEVGPAIGRGGMGTVYRVRTTIDGPAGAGGTVVALKVFHAELVADDVTFQRFQREAELGMRIDHPHVVRTYEIGSEIDGENIWHYMVMDFVEGQTLRELLQEMGALPEHLICQIADQALDALTAVHAEGMVHRDLKPENLVLTREHNVLLTDLGVARLQQQGRDLTRAGEFIGSIAYAAPEQFVDQDHVGPPADLYSFGVVLYEMATGLNPFGTAELTTVITQKVRGHVRRPKLIHRDLDPFLDEVILTCLRTDPAERFSSCEVLRTVLMEGERSTWWLGRIEGEAFPAAARALKRLRPPREAPLIGRGADLDRLHQAYDRAREGEGRTLLLSGAQGAGKSRLVHDFLEELLAPDGPVVLAGRCLEEAPRSLQPFLEGMRDLWGRDADVEQRVLELLPDLAGVAPQLSRLLLGQGTDLGPEALVPACTTLLANLAAGRPVVLVIEDLHRACHEMVGLFGHLARALAEHPVLLVGTYRAEEVEEGSELRSALASLTQRAETLTCAVEPLDRATTDELVRAVVRQGRTVRALGRPLFERSDGNPHILLEMLAHLKATGALTREEDGSWVLAGPVAELELPAGIRELLAVKLDGLDEGQRETLEAASIQGPEFEASLLAAVTGTKRIRLLKRLALLERKHRLIRSSGRNSFRFVSRGLHHVVYDSIPEKRRRRYHSLSADAIAPEREEADQALPDDAAHALVRHLLLAGRIGEAGPHLETAVAYAAAHHHPAHAARFLESLAQSLNGEAAGVRFGALMKLADLYEMLGRRQDRMDALERARAEADRLGGPGPRGRVHAGLAEALWRAGSYEAAEQEAKRGLALAEKAQDRGGEADCLHVLGAVEYRRGDFGGSASYCKDALVIRRAIGDRRGEAATLQALGAVMPEIGEADGALATKQAALDIYRAIGDRRGEGAAVNSLANSLVDTQRIDEALICYEQAIAIAEELGDLPAEAAALYNRGRALGTLARIDEAKEVFVRALDLFREVGDPGGEAEVLDDLGNTIAAYGERSEALRHLETARASAARTGQKALHARVLRHMANLEHEDGAHKEAWRHYEEALALASKRGRALTRLDMGNAALNEGDTGRAVRLFVEGLRDESSGSRALLAMSRLARAHKAAGEKEPAKEYARRVEKALKEESVAPQYGPEIYYSLGTVFDPGEGAKQYLARANELLGARSRSIRSLPHRKHHLTMTWPNREILEEARRRGPA
ncbi:MAG: serine/threonine-protein kinase [Planctomycetota bacterium]|jgi:predicted ATPase